MTARTGRRGSTGTRFTGTAVSRATRSMLGRDAGGSFTSVATAEQRFLAKVVIDGDSGCWLWIASCFPSGYAQLKVDGRNWRAHRWAYEHFVGPIPEGMTLDHLCNVKRCVNPEHLRPMSAGDNIRRANGFDAETRTCKRGHVDDLRWNDRGRQCRQCSNEAANRWHADPRNRRRGKHRRPSDKRRQSR